MRRVELQPPCKMINIDNKCEGPTYKIYDSWFHFRSAAGRADHSSPANTLTRRPVSSSAGKTYPRHYRCEISTFSMAGQKHPLSDDTEMAAPELSPFIPMFEAFRSELDEHQDRRERIIKVSRDVTALSKKM